MKRHTLAAMSLLCIVTTILAAAAANAAGTSTATMPKGYQYDRAGTVARVESYISGISTIQAKFNQVAPDGSVQTGTFYLQRPGKMRWQYNPPTPVLLVSDGDTITYYDSDLGQVNYIALDDTLAGFLARKDVRLESAATKITDFKAEADVIRITIVERTDPSKGALTLEFVDRPLQLKFMTVKDASGNVTRVQLQGAEYGMKLDPALFVFKDPRGIRRGR